MKRNRSHFKCAICGKEYEYAILSGVNKHIKLCHKLTEEEYYEKYCGPASTCIECGKRARFLDIRRGFDQFCSGRCKQQYTTKNTPQDVREKRIEKWKQKMFGTAESRKAFQEKVKDGVKKYYDSLTEEEVVKRKENLAFHARKEWENKTEEEKQEFINQTKQRFCDENYRKEFSKKTSIGTKKAYEKMDAVKKEEMLKNRSRTRRSLFYDTYIDNLKKYTNLKLLDSKEEYINNSEHLYHCNSCNIDFKSKGINIQTVRCPNCINNTFSEEEKNLVKYIKTFYQGTIIENDRNILKPKELDIYIPEKKLAIEFNGTYWHSNELINDRFYHQNKSLSCKEKGIRLIHIFENEWYTRQEICKAIIKNALGIYEQKLNARSCNVKELSSKDYKTFLETNHLQGAVNSPVRYGLYFDNELVAVIGFGKSRFKKDETELHRFCCKINYSIRGAFSKLIKHSGVKNFVSYVDLSHFSGTGYHALHFKEIEITKPSYVWTNNALTLSRFSTQKHKLHKLLGERFDPDLTESENMRINGFFKIYDAGNLKMCYASN